MSLMRWDPVREMISLRDAMDRLFDESFVRPLGPRALAGAGLAVDIEETADDYIVKASLPGLKAEDLNIHIVGDRVTISGEVREEKKEEKPNYLLQERRFGSFSRTLALPVAVDADKAEAALDNGVLTLRIPKAEEVKPKSIKVHAN